MTSFDDAGNLISARFDSQATGVLIEATRLALATPTRSLRCKIGHVLLALWPTLDQQTDWARALETALASGCALQEIPTLIQSYVSDTQYEQTLELKRTDFDPHVVSALEMCDRVENELGDVVWQAQGEPIGVLPLWVAVLSHPGPEDQEAFHRLFDAAKAAAALARLLSGVTPAPSRDLYSPDGALRMECFESAAATAIEKAREQAGLWGSDRIRPAHLLLSLFEQPDAVAAKVLRLQAQLGVDPRTVCERLRIALAPRAAFQPSLIRLVKGRLSDSLSDVLARADALAARNDAPQVAESFLLRAVLESEQHGVAGQILSGRELGLNLDIFLRDLDRYISERRRGSVLEAVSPLLLPGVGPCEDLTHLARTGQLQPSVDQGELVERMLRGLHKRQANHVLITGEPGVGKTALVREFGRRVGAGEIEFLKQKRVVCINCDGLPPEQSRDRLAQLVDSVKGHKDVIVCIDHFEALVRYAGSRESHNRDLLRAALRNQELHLVAVIENRHYAELLSYDHALLELFTRVEVGEADAEQTAIILARTAAPQFERLYGVHIARRAIERAAHGAREFILHERLPTKAIKTLRDACEWVSYELESQRSKSPVVTEREVIRALAERTGIDEGTLAGTGSALNFREELGKSVVGQERAVQVVGDRLTRIKAGAVREGKPAAVFLFAGLTGTGKTELAKAVARMYSASRRLSVYSMTRFTQAHSIQGLTGVPPGYVGYENGGRLINDLNADPYGVVLFDEAEKAHPDIWQSMLSLFDEAWIDDHRNVRAYGNHAIFILTSNAGQEFIRENYRTMDPETLQDEVARRLVDYQNRETGQRPFSPEFLGRFTDIVVFNPLTEIAMHEIARLHVEQLVHDWQTRRNRRVTVSPDLVSKIARASFVENERYDGTRGGRIIAHWVAKLVENPLLRAIVNPADGDGKDDAWHVALDPNGESAVVPEPARTHA